VALILGLYDEATEHFERARNQFEKLGQKIDLALALERLASVYADRGECSRANALSFQSLALYREVGYTTGIFQILLRFARQDLERQENERGVKILAGVRAHTTDSNTEPGLVRDMEEVVSVARTRCDQERFDALWRIGATLSTEELMELARERDAPVLLGLARQAEQ
jgi:hypothetical protein